MKSAPIPANEAARLAALDRYAVLDTLPEAEFDDFTRLASHICGTPVALISFLDGGRQWFKSRVGLEATETAREISFCGHAIHGQDLFEVPDALADERFCDNPLVTGEPNVRFYAAVPLLTPDGHALGTLCVIDRTPRLLTTEQREALAMLSRQIMRLLQLRVTTLERERALLDRDRFFDLSLDPLAIAGTDGYFKRVNPAFCETLGFSADEIAARPFLEFVHPDDHAATLAEMQGLSSGAITVEFENRYRCRDRDWRWLSWKVRPIREENLLYATARDVTERKKLTQQYAAAKDEAQQANDAKSIFLATMSHELRTSMNGMLGMLELLSLSRLDGEQRSTIAMMQESSRSLLRIVDDILDLSKIEAGKLDIRPEPTSITKLIKDVQSIASISAARSGLAVSHVVDSRISPMLLADGLRVRQILSNLVSNALKFTSHGSVEIRADLLDRSGGQEKVRFSVQDTGPGISEETQKLLFLPFSQGDAATAQRAGGTGLGLTICRRLAEMMGGTVHMYSEPGVGTTVTLTLVLPVVEAASLPAAAVPDEPWGNKEPPAATADPARPSTGVAGAEAGGMLLLVDDHPINRMLLQRQAQLLGCAAETAEDGAEALDRWQSGNFAIVITDCQMPGMDGYTLARNIRRLEADKGAPRIPIVACTANALPGEVEKCMAAGMDDVLVKPVQLAALRQVLAQWLVAPGTGGPPGARGSNAASASVHAAEADHPVIRRGDEILDTVPEADFDALAWLAAHVCSVPVAVISLVDHRQIWFESKLDIDLPEVSRIDSFCSVAMPGRELCEVCDALADERLRVHPLVNGPLQMRFFAAMPLWSPDGRILGNLCVLDQVPRRLSPGQREALAKLAQQLMRQLDLRALMLEREQSRLLRDSIDTARLRAERSLRDSEERFRFMVSSVKDYAILTLDAGGHVISWNAGAERSTGWRAEEILGRHFSAFYLPEDLEQGTPEEDLAEAARSGSFEDEGWRVRKDGSKLYASIVLTAIYDEAGVLQGFCKVSRDITERKQAEQELRHTHEKLVRTNQQLVERVLEADLANRAKTTFLATMSHELRTPIHGMSGMLELLNLTRLDAEQQATLTAARESGQALLRVIDDILQFSNLEAGDVVISPQAVSMQEAVESVFHMFSGKARERGIALTHSVDPRISSALTTDPRRLRQILGGFVENAVQFTGARTVAISAEWIGRMGGIERIRLVVQDTGLGIAAPAPQLLVRPPGDAQGPGRISGTALGLTICRRLAELLGGSVDVVSVPGVGTTMSLTLTLPVAGAAPAGQRGGESAATLPAAFTPARAAPAIEQAEREGTLVLLADDHPINRMLLVRQVAMLGYACESVEDGAAALEKWKSGRFGLLITDCDMPRMDGFELTRAIRQIESAKGSRRTPIIACTAGALASEAHACMAAGMDDFLAKPTQLPAILEKLNRWLPIPAPGPAAGTATQSAAAPDLPEPVLESPPIDLGLVAALSGNGMAGIPELLQVIRRTNDEDAAHLRQAVAAGDGAQTVRVTHRMQGAAAMAGAHPLSAICARISAASRAGDWTSVAAEMVMFEKELLRLKAFMEAYPAGTRDVTAGRSGV